MFTADGKPSDDDPRENGPRLGDERVTLVESLRCARLTLEMKCSGLDAEAMARRSVEPSTMSLLGLVRHLAEGERATFRVLMAGQDVPRLFCSDTDRDGDFDGAVPDPRVVAEAWDAWRAEVDFAERFVAEAPSLDITGDDPLNQHGSGGGPMSLREALVGLIWAYGRRMGHVRPAAPVRPNSSSVYRCAGQAELVERVPVRGLTARARRRGQRRGWRRPPHRSAAARSARRSPPPCLPGPPPGRRSARHRTAPDRAGRVPR